MKSVIHLQLRPESLVFIDTQLSGLIFTWERVVQGAQHVLCVSRTAQEVMAFELDCLQVIVCTLEIVLTS